MAGCTIFLGCAVGPNFKSPAPPQIGSYTATPMTTSSGAANVPGGHLQRFVNGADLPAQWWTLFHCQPLDDLIARSLTNNPSLKAAQAALTVAREVVRAQKGVYYPAIAGGFSATRAKTSAQLAPVPANNDLYFNLYTPQVSVAYAPDVFGLNRRTVESLQAQAEQARFALVATHITLSANVAAAAIQEAALREQITATQRLIAINTNLLQILRRQLAKGYVSRLEVAAQESQLAQVTATLPPLRKQLAQQRDLLAALSGSFPSQGPLEQFTLSSLQLPQELPLSLPSRLVRQRPDVRQAEANVHAASAQVGIAVANRLPNFMLSADLGAMALNFSQLLANGQGIWAVAGTVTQPLFQGGTLLHRQRAAQAAYAQATELYRGTVLSAFQNVADTLAALEEDAQGLAAAAAAEQATGVTLSLARSQWQAGYANYVALLTAEQSYRQAVIGLVQARANRYLDTVALFQALGGGWWNRAELANSRD